MVTEPSSPATEPPPKGAGRLPLPSPRVMAVIVGWFFCWPVVFFACLPLITRGDTLEACLFGAGSLLWLVSGGAVCGLLLRMIETRWRPHPLYRRIVVGWFLGWFPLLFVGGHLAALIDHPYWIDLSLIVPGTILWFASCYGIYDMLFAIAEARWPAAKSIRGSIGSLLRMFVSHHHHSP